MKALVLFAAAALAACSCDTGFSCGPDLGLGCSPIFIDVWDEAPPGEEIYLETGAIAVDPRTETIFVMAVLPERELFAIDPDADGYVRVLDLEGRSSVRILFPESSVLLFADRSGDGEEGSRDTIFKLDPISLGLLEELDTHARYRQARLSASRRWLSVIDTRTGLTHVSVMDTRDLTVLMQVPGWPVARWMNARDDLVTVVLDSTARPTIEIWRPDDIDPETHFPHPASSHRIEGASLYPDADLAISPDDATLVVPVVTADEPAPCLAVIEVATWATATVENAVGPVSFTRDGSTILAYRYDEDGPTGEVLAYLVVIDAGTLEPVALRLPFDRAATSFVSETGIYVGIASVTATDSATPTRLAIYDRNARTLTEPDPGVGWTPEAVPRPGHDEMYLVHDAELLRLDFYDAEYEPLPLYVDPVHVALLPRRDRIVLDDLSTSRYSLWDLEDLWEAGWVMLP
jgi:hypothetical protein